MNAFTLTQSVRNRRWIGYPLGIVLLSIALGIRLALGAAALKFPFVIFLPPIIVTTFVGGVIPGIATALVAALLVDWTLIAPVGTLWPEWPDGWLGLGFFAATVALDIALIHAMTTAIRRAAWAEAALRGANEELETRVRERTAALEQQITEREAAEAQVRQMQKIESVGQLTGGIAHDFNNMLAVVTGSLEMARRRSDDPERVSGFLDSAEEGARRAARLVARLLAFSRQQPLDPRALDANRLVGGMIDLLRRTIGEQIKVETILGTGLWRCFADAVQVENAILNLAVNSRDAMPDGGRLTIETANSDLDARYAHRHPDVTPGEYVLVSVTDTGTGMPPQVVERAFDPFYTTKEVGKGTGLGLSQVYGFVRQSGGHVSIDSRSGIGTTVRMYLPRHTGPMAKEAPELAAEVPTAQADEVVLVVEDEPGVRNMSVDALRELGYVVLQSSGPKHALQVVASEPRIDVLFTDVVMPDMNGHQLSEAARVLRPDLKVLFTTGYARNAVFDRGAGQVGTSILPKPFTIAQLATKIRDVLDRDRATLPAP